MVVKCIVELVIHATTTQMCFGCMMTNWNALDALNTAMMTVLTCDSFGFANLILGLSCKKIGHLTTTFGQSFLVMSLIVF
jgi:hypothetical protein